MLTYIELIIAPLLFTYSIILSSKWKKIKTPKKTFIILSILFSFLIAYNGIVKYQKQIFIEQVKSNIGDLNYKTNSNIPRFRIGNPIDYVSMNSTYNNGGIGFLYGADKEVLFGVEIKDKRWVVNSIIRDSKNNIIAAINNNTWKIFDDDYEYNNDENAFEIVTKGIRKVFMHIEYFEGIVYVEGFVFSPTDGIFVETGKYKRNNKEYEILMLKIKNKEDYSYVMSKNKIKPVFKYPREKYLGIRNNRN